MAKIEKPQAVDDLEGIVALCDAIMVARCVSIVVTWMVCPRYRLSCLSRPDCATIQNGDGLMVIYDSGF